MKRFALHVDVLFCGRRGRHSYEQADTPAGYEPECHEHQKQIYASMLRQEAKLHAHAPQLPPDLQLETEHMLAGACPHADPQCIAHLTPCRAHSVPVGKCAASPYAVRHAASLNRPRSSPKFVRENLENAKNQNSLSLYSTQERVNDGRQAGV